MGNSTCQYIKRDDSGYSTCQYVKRDGSGCSTCPYIKKDVKKVAGESQGVHCTGLYMIGI